jgi:hypothetical protein
MVTSKEHLEELAHAPTNVLSLHAVATEVNGRSCIQTLVLILIDASAKTHHGRIRMEG